MAEQYLPGGSQPHHSHQSDESNASCGQEEALSLGQLCQNHPGHRFANGPAYASRMLPSYMPAHSQHNSKVLHAGGYPFPQSFHATTDPSRRAYHGMLSQQTACPPAFDQAAFHGGYLDADWNEGEHLDEFSEETLMQCIYGGEQAAYTFGNQYSPATMAHLREHGVGYPMKRTYSADLVAPVLSRYPPIRTGHSLSGVPELPPAASAPAPGARTHPYPHPALERSPSPGFFPGPSGLTGATSPADSRMAARQALQMRVSTAGLSPVHGGLGTAAAVVTAHTPNTKSDQHRPSYGVTSPHNAGPPTPMTTSLHMHKSQRAQQAAVQAGNALPAGPGQVAAAGTRGNPAVKKVPAAKGVSNKRAAGNAAGPLQKKRTAQPTSSGDVSDEPDELLKDIDVLADMPKDMLPKLLERAKRKGRGGRAPAQDPRLDPKVDPKKARRILANRMSAARSKLKQRLLMEGLKAKHDALTQHKTEAEIELDHLRDECERLEKLNIELMLKLQKLVGILLRPTCISLALSNPYLSLAEPLGAVLLRSGRIPERTLLKLLSPVGRDVTGIVIGHESLSQEQVHNSQSPRDTLQQLTGIIHQLHPTLPATWWSQWSADTPASCRITPPPSTPDQRRLHPDARSYSNAVAEGNHMGTSSRMVMPTFASSGQHSNSNIGRNPAQVNIISVTPTHSPTRTSTAAPNMADTPMATGTVAAMAGAHDTSNAGAARTAGPHTGPDSPARLPGAAYSGSSGPGREESQRTGAGSGSAGGAGERCSMATLFLQHYLDSLGGMNTFG